MNNAKNNKVCQICGTPYYVCSHCNKINSWRTVADKPSCYQVYLILTGLNQNTMNEKEVVEQFGNIGINLTTIENYKTEFVDSVYNRIYNILKNQTVNKNSKRKNSKHKN